MNPEFWQDKRVLVTGHSGFKGTWLTTWLELLGSKVFGYSKDPPSEPNMFMILHEHGIYIDGWRIADIRDREIVSDFMAETKPDIIFHLAAQPIVKRSYEDPGETFSTNILGTCNVLEAARHCESVKAIVVVTTDKVYEDAGIWPYRENDRLGGYDPYSASKACCEFVVDSYRKSFFREADIRVATARAGNVIGGGDFGKHRIVPDIVRAWTKGEPLQLRNPHQVRPWQHVLEPMHGYLMLAERLCCPDGDGFECAWNFGPSAERMHTVGWLVATITGSTYPLEVEKVESREKETDCLLLDSTKARRVLEWRPKYDVLKAVEKTAVWYRAWNLGTDMRAFTEGQIKDYFNDE